MTHHQRSCHMGNFYRPVRVSAWLWNLEFCTKIAIRKLRYHFLQVWRHKKRSAVILTYFFALFDRYSHFWDVFCQFCDQAEIHFVSYLPIKILHMADFFRVVRSLVNFSLVTKRTKHVSKVREVVRKCKKICEDDTLTLLMTSHTQKVTSWFLDSNF